MKRLVVVVLSVGAVLGPAVAFASPLPSSGRDVWGTVSGSPQARSGRLVHFSLAFRGLDGVPSEPAVVFLQRSTARYTSNDYVALDHHWFSDGRGSARVAFKWPAKYRHCAGSSRTLGVNASRCQYVRWERGAVVDVDVCLETDMQGAQCGRKTVVVDQSRHHRRHRRSHH